MAFTRSFRTASGRSLADSLRNFGTEKVGAALAVQLYREATGIMEQSKPLVPVDTGTLRSSAYVSEPIRDGDQISIEFGYGGPAGGVNPKTGQSVDSYALFVHENLEAFHPVGMAKFLEIPFLAARRDMTKRIAENIRAALAGRAR